MDKRFYNPQHGEMSFSEVVNTLVTTMEEDAAARYAIFVGTDAASGMRDIDFVSAIVLHKIGKGGRYFWTREKTHRVHSLRQKIWHEALLSFELAQSLIAMLAERVALVHNLEIHIDIGENGRTKEMIDEVVGMIVGSGFAVRIKPHAYAASSVADRHT